MSEQAVEVRGLRVRRADLTVRQNLRYFARLLGLWRPMLVVAAFTAGALVLASLTLRRRTP